MTYMLPPCTCDTRRDRPQPVPGTERYPFPGAHIDDIVAGECPCCGYVIAMGAAGLHRHRHRFRQEPKRPNRHAWRPSDQGGRPDTGIRFYPGARQEREAPV